MTSVSDRAAASGPALPGPRHEGYRAGDPEYRRIAVALFAAGVATFALLYSTQALLPVLARAFSLSAGQSTLSLSLTTAGLGVALLVTGPVSEVLGRTRLIRLSLTASGLVALACAVAPSWDVLLGLRLVQGIALAGLPAAATAYLREETHPGTYSRAAGLYIGGTALGGLTGRLVTSAVADAAGWRWALAAIAAVGLGCAAVVVLTLPPSRNFTPAPVRAGTLAAMIRRAVSDPALLALYAIGCCSMGAFVTIFNAMSFRLTSAPFDLSAGAAGLVFGRLPGRQPQFGLGRADGRPLLPPGRRGGQLPARRGRRAGDAAGLAAGHRGRPGRDDGRVLRGAQRGQRLGAGPGPRRGRRLRAGGLAVPVRVLPGVVRVRHPGRARLEPGRVAGRGGPGAGPLRGLRAAHHVAMAHPGGGKLLQDTTDGAALLPARVAVKPTVVLAPGASVPLYDWFVTVTLLPDWS